MPSRELETSSAAGITPAKPKGRKKYETQAAARKAGAVWWREDSWPQNLYLKLDVGRFFYRAQRTGFRPFLKLDTADYKIAKRKLAEKMLEVSAVREQGANTENADFRTLGACAEELIRIWARSERKGRTLNAYSGHLQRLRMHWPLGKFDAYLAANVDHAAFTRLRKHLSRDAVFAAGRKDQSVKRPKMRKGYANNIVNQTLWALKMLLDVAVKKHVIHVNPWVTKSSLEGKLTLPKVSRKPVFPSSETMQALFAEMRRIPPLKPLRWDGTRTRRESPAMEARRRWYANRSADLAELMAYTGCRHGEALELRVGYDGKNLPNHLYIDGTKSKQSKRDVPVVIPGLRALLDRLKAGKQPEDKLFPEPFDCGAALDRARLRLKLPAKFVQHEMRHYFATVILEASEVTFQQVGEYLGHSDGGMLAAKTYSHLRPNARLATAERLAVHFAKRTAVNVIPFASGPVPAISPAPQATLL